MILEEQTSAHLADLFSAAQRPDPSAHHFRPAGWGDERGPDRLPTRHDRIRGVTSTARIASNETGPEAARRRQVFYALDDDHVAKLYLPGLDHVEHG
ncbi:MAG: hypothetical protein MZV64_19240 [Ignavibacteriales bacterium]|nr:hypothetical protein [Ignavibacteriales bacterium]